MSNFDYLNIDGKLLQLLLAVMETGSVTSAAQRLDVTQSAVSHLLDKLRAIVDDPLFVKSGRGIVPTARAEALAIHARILLDEMQRFAVAHHFNPATLNQTLTIAANDFQRDLLLPSLLNQLRKQAPGIRLRVIPSDVPGAEMLRDGRCELVISPRPPDASDILQKRLFEDQYRVFFDAAARAAPNSAADYLAAEHITVLYEPHRMLDVDQVLAAQGYVRQFAIKVPGFSGIPSFLQRSQMLTTLPGLIGRNLLHGFDSCAMPIACPALPMYMIWHLRYQHDPIHHWVRQELEAVVADLMRD